MNCLLLFTLFVPLVVGNDCASRISIPAIVNNTNGGEPYCSGSGNSTVWLEYTGTCIGQAQICLQSNQGQCATGTGFNLKTNSFRGPCDNLAPRVVGCSDDDAAASPSCADFGCGTGFSEYVTFPTTVGKKTIFLVASASDTAVGPIKATVLCHARSAMIHSAPLLANDGEIVTLNITTVDAPNPIVRLYNSRDCAGVSLDSTNSYFECDGMPIDEFPLACTGNCLVNLTLTGSGHYFWFIKPSSDAGFPEFRYSASPLVVLPNCDVPTLPCCKFCTSNLANCTEYANMTSCLAACSEWIYAAASDLTGNTVECRTHYSTTGVPSDCANTGPTGGGVCVPDCSVFCPSQMSVCGTQQFPDVPTCLAACSNWTAGTLEATTGDSLACRWNQLAFLQHSIGQGCEVTGDASAVCVDTLQPTTSAPTSTPTTAAPTTSTPTTHAPTASPSTAAPTTTAPTRAPSTATPTTTAPTRAPSTTAPSAAPTSIACPQTAIANFYKNCKSSDFIGSGNCKLAGRSSPCTLVCRLYSETLEKQLVCPNSTSYADCAATCIASSNQTGYFNSSALTCMMAALNAGEPMCGYGMVSFAVAQAPVASLVIFVLFLISL